MSIRALFLDVANTLLHKPQLYPEIHRILSKFGHQVPLSSIIYHHRIISEIIVFPDKTSHEFYFEFNSHLLRSFGIIPSIEITDELFNACSYLPWKAFDDVSHLKSISLPIGILSNWDDSLRTHLSKVIDIEPKWILGSKEFKIRKPSLDFFKLAVNVSTFKFEEVAYVGDSLRLDIEPALKLGLAAFLIDRDNLFPTATVNKIKHFGELSMHL